MTLGDIAVLDETTILVEGITDQIILASASRRLEAEGGPHFDLSKTALVPYGNERVLDSLLAIAARARVRVLVVVDGDEQGKKVAAVCQARGVRRLSVVDVIGERATDTSIEDLLGTSGYVRWVNESYATFDWFRPIVEEDFIARRGTQSLGRAMEAFFETVFAQQFSKHTVAVSIANGFWNGEPVPEPLQTLIRLVTCT